MKKEEILLGVLNVSRLDDQEIFTQGMIPVLDALLEKEDKKIVLGIRKNCGEDYLITSFAISRRMRVRLIDRKKFRKKCDAFAYFFLKKKKKGKNYDRYSEYCKKKKIPFFPVWLSKKRLEKQEKRSNKGGLILGSHLYVPEDKVTYSMLDAFTYEVDNKYDEEEPFLYQSYQEIPERGLIGFHRGNIRKIYRHFRDLKIEDNRVDTKFRKRYRFSLPKGWDYRPHQKETINAYLDKKFRGNYVGGQLIAPPRSGKCCLGETIFHVPDRGSVYISSLFSNVKETDKEIIVPHTEDIITKDGTKKTSHLYCKLVDNIIEIKTERGFSFGGTLNHPLFIDKGDGHKWINLEDVEEGNKIALKQGSCFTEKTSKYVELLAKYVNANRKFSTKVVLRVMTLNHECQEEFINNIKVSNEILIDNEEVLSLLQKMLLNLGYLSRIIT